MEPEVLDNHRVYEQRVQFYRGFGYDLEKERDFILDAAMPVSGKILEIGTGKGHFALALAKRGFKFVSIDISAEEQRIALLNLKYSGLEKNAELRLENAEALSFPDKSFDVIFSINVFHHLQNPLKVLDEMVRLVRPPGKIVLSDFTDKGLEIINACHTHEHRIHDYFQHRLTEARDYFVRKGFTLQETQSVVQHVMAATAPDRV